MQIPRAFSGLFEPSRYKAFYGGRGGAKSQSFATALLLAGAERPLRVLCAREVQKSIQDSVKQLLDDKVSSLGLGEFYESILTEIRGANGTEFKFSGLGKMTTDQIKSMEGIDIVWVEEAQTISAKSLETLIPTIRKKNSELWFSWNPRNASDPIDQLFRGDHPPADAIIEKVNYSENPFFPEELEAERVYDQKAKPDRYAHIWEGEYEPTAIGAIWTRDSIARNRRSEAPGLTRIVVGVDPAVTDTESSDEHGIVVVGLGEDKRGYVLEDASQKGTPREWANRAIAAFDTWEADAIVIEVNQGGDMVRHTLESVRPGLPIIEERATRGKHVRAEPISALYAMDRASHVGTFSELENQMCQMGSGKYLGEGSPDRVDALVWAFTNLFGKMTRRPPKPVFVDRRPVAGGWMG